MYLTRMELDMRRKKTMLAFANRRLFHGAVESAFVLKKNGLFRHMAQLQSESMEWTA